MKDTPLSERWRGMGWDEGSKSAIGKMVKMDKIDHPSHHHTLDPSPHNLLSAGFSLKSHFWNRKAVLEESFELPRNSAIGPP